MEYAAAEAERQVDWLGLLNKVKYQGLGRREFLGDASLG
jgi:hypothetical protein